MKESTKKLLSFALASTLVAGVPVAAHADNTVSIKGVVEEAGDIVFYTVKDGDTLGKIAERYYGDAAYWEQLAAYNNMQYPSKLAIGQAVLLPRYLPMLEYAPCVPTQDNQEATVVVDNYAEDSTYTVKKGDTLYCIVRVQYGLTNQEAVDKLATYNGLSDPNRLSVGQVLYIPCIEKLTRLFSCFLILSVLLCASKCKEQPSKTQGSEEAVPEIVVPSTPAPDSTGDDAKPLQQRINRQHGTHITEYAEEIGLGSRKYNIVNIDGD